METGNVYRCVNKKLKEPYLPENEMLFDDSLDGFVGPYVTI
jgi:hypothetical protein